MRRWLQGTGVRARVLLLLTALVVVVAGVALVVGLARDDGVDDASEGLAVDPARVAELEAAEVAHDAENLTASIEHAQHVQAELVPVLDALHGVLPVDGTTPVAPAAEDVAAWRATLDTLTSETQSLPSGSSEHNIVRNGMLTSVELLGDTVDAVDLARVADASSAPGLYALAGDLRTRAVDTWGLAAVQLDLRATAAGQGHVHVFLPVHPDDALDGGLGTHGEQDDPGTDHDH